MSNPYQLSKEQAAKFAKAERDLQKALRRQHELEFQHRKRIKKLGYDQNRPNHMVHDSLGDPATCNGDHNHPEHIGEG